VNDDELPEPGWYTDPDGSGRERWWDGSAWTTRHLKRSTAATTDTISSGDVVKIVASDVDHADEAGTVEDVVATADGVQVHVQFAGDSDTYAYRRDEVLRCVPDVAEAPTPVVATTPPADSLEHDLPAGWYDDPNGSGGDRWWDGGAWTTRTRPSSEDTDRSLPDWYDDPDGSGGERWWDGHQWTRSRRPIHGEPANESAVQRFSQAKVAEVVDLAKRKPLLAAGSAVAAVVLVVVIALAWGGGRWSEFPHALNCAIVTDSPIAGLQMPPEDARVEQVALSHPGGDRMTLEIDFAGALSDVDAFGLWINISGLKEADGGGATVSIFSPRGGDGWVAGRADFQIRERIGEAVPDYPDGNLLTAVSTGYRSLELTLNLEGQPEFFPAGSYTPDVTVNLDAPGYSDAPLFRPQQCKW
jgi:hypothetical protein